METFTADTQIVKDELSKPHAALQREVVHGLTKIALALRQEVTELDFAAMADALEGYDPRRVSIALDRCRTELLFLPKPCEVIERLPEKTVENKRPQGELIRDFFEPYSSSLRLHVFEYEGGHRQARLEKLGVPAPGQKPIPAESLGTAAHAGRG